MARLSLTVVLLAFGFVAHFAPITAQEKKEPTPKQKPVPSLKVGDLAPPLKVTKWLQGPEVKKFEPGKVYVVEFWAVWCGPCIGAMPHLAELQAEYKEKNVTVIGFTSRDILGKPEHSEKEVAEFMERRGKKFGYTFAYADDGTTAESWLTAAGREGIPCTFVVDKAGRIAYIGHPMFLSAVLPKVVEGVATAKQVGDEMAKIEAEFHDLSALLSRDPKTGLQAIKQFEAKYPQLIDFSPWVRVRLSYLPKYGESGEATKYAEALVAKAIKQKDVQVLRTASAILRLGDGKESQELLAIAVKAAEAEVLIDGGKDARSLINLADAHLASGDKAKAKEFAYKANDAASGESAAFREYIAKETVRLSAEK
jgi:thiol-disulfide isomerase/thioredoxin